MNQAHSQADDNVSADSKAKSSFGKSAEDATAACPICGCREYRKISVREERFAVWDEFMYAVCKDCKLVRILDPPAAMDRYYAGYSYHRARTSEKATPPGPLRRACRWLSSILMKPLDRFYPTDTKASVLDVGCARGLYLRELKRRAFSSLVGIEPSRDAVEAKVEPELEIHCCGLEEFQGAGRFQVITLNQVFEHFNDPRKMLEKLASLLDADGLLVMSFPNYRSLARLLFGSFWPGYDAPRHCFTFSPGNITRLCEQCGLKVRRVR